MTGVGITNSMVKHWAGLLDQRELALLILENADAALKQAEHDEQTLRDEKRCPRCV